MIVTRDIHIEPADRPMLEQAGLADFDTLMAGEVGEAIKQKDQTSVRRVVLPTGEFYLKRSTGDSPGRIVRALLSGHGVHVSCWREMQMARELASAGFAVMRPAAWGEQRRCGVGMAGFMLAHAVPGMGLDAVFNQGDEVVRRRALMAMASLLGRLHVAGFYPSLRLRDLIVPDPAADPLPLVMIDCEAARPGARPFDQQRCIAGLAKCHLKNLSLMERALSRAEQLRVLQVYRRTVAPRWSIGLRDLADQVGHVINLLKKPGKKYENR